MTPALDPLVAPPTSPAPTSQNTATALAFRQKETVLAGYLAAFAVVYYRLPAERAPAQLTATLHVETADTAFPPAAVTLQLADDRALAAVADEAATRLLMALAGVADELGAAIVRGRLAFPAPEAQNPDQTWELTIGFGTAPDEAATLSFSSLGGAAAPRETAYLTAHVQAVVAQLAQNPAAPVGHVFFLAEEEVAQLRQFRAGPPLAAEGGPQQLHQLFEETARTYPNNVALSSVPTTSSTLAPTSWPPTCGSRACRPAILWACLWPSRWNYTSGCWPCSRPARPTCRSIYPSRPTAWHSSWATAGRGPY
jgi:hypothetical protein